MPNIDVKSERVVNGGFCMSAHVKDWDLMQSFPQAIVSDIVTAITKRFLEENGDLILSLVKDPELLAVALSREMDRRVRDYISDKKKQEEQRLGKK